MKKVKPSSSTEKEKLNAQIEEEKEQFSALIAIDFQHEKDIVLNKKAKKSISKKNAE